MEKKTTNTKPKANAFMNVLVKVKAADGTEYTYKGGIPLSNAKASEKGLIDNPEVLNDKKRTTIEASIHVIAVEPEEVKF